MAPSLDFINTYYTEEKIQNLFLIIIGCITFFLSLFFLFIIKYSFFKGMSVPFLIVGLFYLIVGTTMYDNSSNNLLRMEQISGQSQQKIQTEELPHVEKALKNFTIYKWAEFTILVIGIILFINFQKSQQTFWKGIGLALIIQFTLMLTLDLMAEKRAKIYNKQLSVLGQTLNE